MAIELTREPTSASTGDALYFTATGSSEEQLAIVVTADGDEMQRSPTFGIEDAPEGTGSDRFTLSIMEQQDPREGRLGTSHRILGRRGSQWSRRPSSLGGPSAAVPDA